METTLHGYNIFIAKFAEDQFAAVPFDRRYRKVRDIRITDFILLGNFIGQTAKPGAKYDGGFGTGMHLTFQISCGFLYFL